MVKGQREKIQNGQKGIRGLKTRVGRGAALAEGSQIVQWRYTGCGSPRRKSQCYE